MEKTFTGIFEKVGDWYIAYAEELPGANTQGRTLEEARENLREAIELVLAARSRKDLGVPPPGSGCRAWSR